MDKPKEQASFISDFKEDQDKQFVDLSKNRRVRLRSSIFDLPEFVSAPLISVVVLVRTQEQLSDLEFFIEGTPNDEFEIIFVIPNRLEISQLMYKHANIHKIDLSQANHSTWLNQAAKKTKGKIICLMTSIKNFKLDQLLETGRKIENCENNLVHLLKSQTELIGVAMTRDLYYLAHGVDELIEDINVFLADLVLRVEMLGGQIGGANWPRRDIPVRAEKNVRTGRLTVNHGLTTFISDN